MAQDQIYAREPVRENRIGLHECQLFQSARQRGRRKRGARNGETAHLIEGHKAILEWRRGVGLLDGLRET